MGTPSLPCPHCSAPIAPQYPRLWPGYRTADGVCPACLHAYRFGTAARALVVAMRVVLGILGWLAYVAFERCAACMPEPAEPAGALALTMMIAATVAFMLIGSSLALRAYVARAIRSGRAARVLEPVDDTDAPLVAAYPRAHPATAIAAALLLLGMLAWVLVLDVQALRSELQASPPPPAGLLAPWIFVAIEAVTAVVVVVCAALLTRRLAARWRARKLAGGRD